MNERAQKIVEIINDVTDDVDVQAGYPDANGNTKVTWCNRALNRMLVMLGGKVRLVLDHAGINWTNANRMVNNARSNLVCIPDEETAQSRANMGDLIIAVRYNSAGPGHVALVCPDENEFSITAGPRIGQAGARCGIMYAAQGFGQPRSEIEYYHVPYENEGMSA